MSGEVQTNHDLEAMKTITTFDELLQNIEYVRHEFMRERGRCPKTVFLGFAEVEAFKTIPPWQLTSREPYGGSEQVNGLEVVRVLKDSFLQVA